MNLVPFVDGIDPKVLVCRRIACVYVDGDAMPYNAVYSLIGGLLRRHFLGVEFDPICVRDKSLHPSLTSHDMRLPEGLLERNGVHYDNTFHIAGPKVWQTWNLKFKLWWRYFRNFTFLTFQLMLALGSSAVTCKCS